MLRIVPSSGGAAKDYFDDQLQQGDYYSEKGQIIGEWGGRGAELLGLAGQEIQREVFHNLCDGKMPDGLRNLTAQKNDPEKRIVAYDLVQSAPKAFSALCALTRDPELEKMFQDSIKESMEDVQRMMVVRVRAKQDIADIDSGKTPGFHKQILCKDKKTGAVYYKKEYFRHSDNLVYGNFMHFTTRPVENEATGKTISFPQVHVHAFTFNATYDEHASPKKKGEEKGVWKAGNFAEIKRDGQYFDARFQSRLTDKLVKAGYAVERTKDSWTLTGVPDSLVKKFSERSTEIEAFAKEKGITSAKEKDNIGARTRLKKTSGLPMNELYELWWTKVADDGERQAMQKVANQLCGNKSPEVYNEELNHPALAMDSAIDHCFTRNSVIPQTHLVTQALRNSFGLATPEEIDGQLNRRELKSGVKKARTLVSTENVYKEEKVLLKYIRDTQGTVNRLYSGDYEFMSRIDEKGKPWELRAEQKSAVMNTLHSNDRVNIIRGAAGVGKSVSLEDLKRACGGKGIGVFGCAPTTRATHGLVEKGYSEAATS